MKVLLSLLFVFSPLSVFAHEHEHWNHHEHWGYHEHEHWGYGFHRHYHYVFDGYRWILVWDYDEPY